MASEPNILGNPNNSLNVSELIPDDINIDTIGVINKFKALSSNFELNSIPEDIIFPDELNHYLREQIQYYLHENGMIKKNLEDIEVQYEKSTSKVNELEKKLKAYQNVDNREEFIMADQVASLKIVDLSKKLREKTSEVESLKSKYSKLEKHLFELKNNIPEKGKKVLVEPIVTNPQNKEDEVKKLQDKLNSLMSKFTETKNLNLQLKNDLKLANKWLQQEVGETFESLQSVYNANGNWRGRAQIIFDLQQKNSDLKEKLKNTQVKVSGFSLQTVSSFPKVDSKSSTLSKDYDDLKYKYEDIKKKNEALKARCKVLDCDLIIAKSKLTTFKEQAARDQDFIATLTTQISSHKVATNDETQYKNSIKKLQYEKEQLVKQVEEYQSVIKNLRDQIDVLKKSKDESEKRNTTEEDLLRETFMKNKDDTSKINKEKLQILNLLETQSLRLKAERDAHTKTMSALRTEKCKATKAEAIASLELNSCRSGYSSLSNLRTLDLSLKDQLELAEENIKALQTRLDIETFERKTDLQEFTQILKNYDFKN